MAISKSIRVALDDVFGASAEIEALFNSFEMLTGDGPSNPFVYTMRQQFERYAEKCDALEKILRQQAIPLLEDFDAARPS